MEQRRRFLLANTAGRADRRSRVAGEDSRQVGLTSCYFYI